MILVRALRLFVTGVVILTVIAAIALLLMDRGVVPPLGPALGLEPITSDVPLVGSVLSGSGHADKQSAEFGRAMQRGDLASVYRQMSRNVKQETAEAEFVRQVNSQAQSVGRVVEIKNISPMYVQGDVAWVLQDVRMARDGREEVRRHRAVFVWEEGSWRFLFSEPMN